MEIVHNRAALERYMGSAVKVSGDSPVLIDYYLKDAIEVDVDALCDGTDVFVAGVMEHIEEAGIHSGDSACSLPPYSLSDSVIEEMKRQAEALAHALKVIGLMNIQFAVQGQNIFILEVNPRASRTVPFVAKATGKPVAKIAARIMAGEKLTDFDLSDTALGDHIAVKEAVFPFARFPGVDVMLGPEMRSTGEVIGLDTNFETAFAKAQLGCGADLPAKGCAFISVKDSDKEKVLDAARMLIDEGISIIATAGTASFLREQGLDVKQVNKVQEGQPHIVDAMINGEVQLVFNTTEGAQAIKDSFAIRQTALLQSIPYYTTVAGCRAAAKAIRALRKDELDVAPLQSYFRKSA